MQETNRDLPKLLRKRIRDFEDRKISASDLAREVQHLAREIHDTREAGLRRALEQHGNRINVLAERAIAQQVHGEVLAVVDEIVGDLVNFGY